MLIKQTNQIFSLCRRSERVRVEIADESRNDADGERNRRRDEQWIGGGERGHDGCGHLASEDGAEERELKNRVSADDRARDSPQEFGLDDGAEPDAR